MPTTSTHGPWGSPRSTDWTTPLAASRSRSDGVAPSTDCTACNRTRPETSTGSSLDRMRDGGRRHADAAAAHRAPGGRGAHHRGDGPADRRGDGWRPSLAGRRCLERSPAAAGGLPTVLDELDLDRRGAAPLDRGRSTASCTPMCSPASVDPLAVLRTTPRAAVGRRGRSCARCRTSSTTAWRGTHPGGLPVHPGDAARSLLPAAVHLRQRHAVAPRRGLRARHRRADRGRQGRGDVHRRGAVVRAPGRGRGRRRARPADREIGRAAARCSPTSARPWRSRSRSWPVSTTTRNSAPTWPARRASRGDSPHELLVFRGCATAAEGLNAGIEQAAARLRRARAPGRVPARGLAGPHGGSSGVRRSATVVPSASAASSACSTGASPSTPSVGSCTVTGCSRTAACLRTWTASTSCSWWCRGPHRCGSTARWVGTCTAPISRCRPSERGLRVVVVDAPCHHNSLTGRVPSKYREQRAGPGAQVGDAPARSTPTCRRSARG